MAEIFISYRRADAEGWAGRLSDSLKAELSRINIFRDIDDIPPGVEFDTYINDAVGSCDVLIALIGPRWLTVADKNGLRRLDDPKDFTRLEILTALKRNVRVIPALVGGAQMPDADALPEDIKPLTRRQAYELSDSRWVDDCRKLANVLRSIAKPNRSRMTKIAVIVLFALIATGYGAKLWNDHRAETARQEAAARETAEQEKLAAKKAAADAERQKLLDETTARLKANKALSDAAARLKN
jgi:TIR domain